MGPLDGVKVLDFGWGGVGPQVTRYLGHFGAQVIKVESSTAIDMVRTSGPDKDGVAGMNRSYWAAVLGSGKLSIGVNIKTPDGKEIIKKLVGWADVVSENFSAGTMKELGLGYDELAKIKPEIIMASASMMGQCGPRSHLLGWGPQLAALIGAYHLTGWPDRGPVPCNIAYTDHISPWFVLVAILAALDYRRRTGRGQYIDLSQYEAGVSFFSTGILDFAVNARIPSRNGNRDRRAVPHGAYPCEGEERWCVISVFSEDEWTAFCKATGHIEWCEDQRFASFLARKQNEEELDRLVAEWTRGHSAEQVMATLQAVGVPSGVVESAEDLVDKDPQVKGRGFFFFRDHAELGRSLHYGFPLKFSLTPGEGQGAACLGEHTFYVCRDILGMSEEEVATLMASGVLE